MTNPTPTTPEACRAEQERVLEPLEKYETLLAEYEREDEAYWLQDDVLSKPYPRRLEAKGRQLERLREELNNSLTPTLARQYAALLATHAEALELLRDCDTELDDLMRRVRRLAQDAPDDDTTDADELRRRIAALTAQAPAGGEG